MEKENQNEKILSRRDFFKNAAKKALPILAVVGLGSITPIIANTAEKGLAPTSCSDGCYGGCKDGCYGGCSGTCSRVCNSNCDGTCKGYCNTGCYTGCTSCVQACKDNCQRTMKQ